MRQLLYEEHPGPLSKGQKGNLVTAVLFFVLGVMLALMHDEVEYGFQNREMKMLLMWILMYAFFFLGVCYISFFLSSSKCWIKIYDDHIEGQTTGVWRRKETFSLPLERISSVTKDDQLRQVIIHAAGTTFKVVCRDQRRTFQVIDQLMLSRSRRATPTVRRCAGCGQVLAANALFCPNCGTRNEV